MIPLSDPDLRRHTTAYVTTGLIIANVLAFLYQWSLDGLDQFLVIYRYGAIPAELTGQVDLGPARVGTSVGPVLVDLSGPLPNWATMFSSMFLHGGWLHLGGNMVFLWVFGRAVEDRLGHVRFLAFYLAAGVAAVWAQTGVDTGSQVPMVGASGAIAGVLGAYFLLFPFSRIITLFMFGFIFSARVPAFLLLGFWAALQAFNGVGSLGTSSAGSGVAYFAHLGGFAAGLAAIAAYRVVRGEPLWPRRRPPPSWRWPPPDDIGL